MIDDVITLAIAMAATQTLPVPPPVVVPLTYKQVRDANGKFIFGDGFMDCSEFIYYLLHEKYSTLYDVLADNDSGNTTTLKTNIEAIGSFASTPVSKSIALWWDEDNHKGAHVELVVSVTGSEDAGYKINSIGARGEDGTPVPKRTQFQSYDSFDNINPNKLLGFWKVEDPT